jgi:hypothetical protein
MILNGTSAQMDMGYMVSAVSELPQYPNDFLNSASDGVHRAERSATAWKMATIEFRSAPTARARPVAALWVSAFTSVRICVSPSDSLGFALTDTSCRRADARLLQFKPSNVP